MRITILIRSLEVGGAEKQAELVARLLDAAGHDVHVIVFYDAGPGVISLRNAGVRLTSMQKKGRWDLFGFLYRLCRSIRASRPDVLYSYMDVANLLSLLVYPFANKPRLVWGVRNEFTPDALLDWPSRIATRLEIVLARFAYAVVSNSRSGMRRFGTSVSSERLRYVPNGIDTDFFKRCETGRQRLRRQWGVPADSMLPVVGIVASLHPRKDHETFLRACALLARETAVGTIVVVGRGSTERTLSLSSLATRLDLQRVIFLGEQIDMPSIYSALDLLVLSSRVEGFPNVLAESMACETIAVCTDCGDAREIVVDPQLVAPIADPEGLKTAMMSGLARREQSALGRAKMIECFGTKRLLTGTIASLS